MSIWHFDVNFSGGGCRLLGEKRALELWESALERVERDSYHCVQALRGKMILPEFEA
jgi:hypothetical protein